MWNYIFLALSFLAPSQSQQTNRTYIDIVPMWSDCPQNGTQLCYTLAQCLDDVACLTTNTEVLFSAGQHWANGRDEYALVEDVEHLALVGEIVDGKPATQIHCNTTKGFAILYAIDIQITGVEFVNCGTLIPTDLQETAFNVYTRTYIFTPSPLKAALFLVFVQYLDMELCLFNNSEGFGLLAINIIGVSTIKDSAFVSSNRQALQYAGNITHCRPDSLRTQDCMGGNAVLLFQDLAFCPSTHYSFRLKISNCHFLYGVNLDVEGGGWYFPPNYLASAGGLSIFSGQTSYSIYIEVSDVVIDWIHGSKLGCICTRSFWNRF